MTPRIQSWDTGAIITYEYNKGESIDNSLRHQQNPLVPKEMYLPFGFSLSKKIWINSESMIKVELTVENTGDLRFNYALGWHPAFLTNGDPKRGRFRNMYGVKVDDIENLVETSKTGAHHIPEIRSIFYRNNETRRGIELGKNFDGCMLWAPNKDMFCIEPLTDKREKGALIDLSSRYYEKPENSYNRFIAPGQRDVYSMYIRPF